MLIENEEYYSINIVDKNGKVVASITDDLLLVDEEYQAIYEHEENELLFRDDDGIIRMISNSEIKS